MLVLPYFLVDAVVFGAVFVASHKPSAATRFRDGSERVDDTGQTHEADTVRTDKINHGDYPLNSSSSCAALSIALCCAA